MGMKQGMKQGYETGYETRPGHEGCRTTLIVRPVHAGL